MSGKLSGKRVIPVTLPKVSRPLAPSSKLTPRRQAIRAELIRRNLSLSSYGSERADVERECEARFKPYQFDPAGYIEKFLGWTPWRGNEEAPGQVEILEAYTLALRQQHEKLDFESGKLLENQLQYWTPGEPIKYRLRIEAGHTVGKTKLSSGIVNHFFDCFVPSIIYCFAPSREQIHDLLFKEIKSDRTGKGLPGRILDLGLDMGPLLPDHFCRGRATSDSRGRGTERIQGQHGKYLLFDLDEAEGIDDYVYDAVDSMTSGGICIVLMTANPKSRTSKFHKQRVLSTVKNFRISCISHPNVLQGREIVPEAVKRSYVQDMVEKHCEPAPMMDEDSNTFKLTFPVHQAGQLLPAGTIWKPNNEFCWRVLGLPPKNATGNTFISVGRYEAAVKREIAGEVFGEDPRFARMGVDVARWGSDAGRLYVRHAGRIWRAATFEKKDYISYARSIQQSARLLREAGVLSLHVRVDAGGGFGGGVISHLSHDDEFEPFRTMFEDCLLLEVHFGGGAYDQKSYRNLVTEMYAEADETLKRLRIEDPPPELEEDLTERTFEWINWKGVDVKAISAKDVFKKEHSNRSPDDGDGFVLATAPDHIFAPRPEDDEHTLMYESRVHISEM